MRRGIIFHQPRQSGDEAGAETCYTTGQRTLPTTINGTRASADAASNRTTTFTRNSKRPFMYANLGLFIDGQWLNGDGRRGEDVINPATEKPLAHLPHASAADLDHALEAAKKGIAAWRATSAYDRAKIMRKAADLMRERHDTIAQILVQEQGKVY